MTKLSQFLKDAAISQERFAKQVGISPGYASEIVAGVKTPGLALAIRIEASTGGEIPAASWHTLGRKEAK